MTRSQSAATQYYDRTAPAGSVMLLTGSANAVPSNTGARYFDVGYLSREALGPYRTRPAATTPRRTCRT